MGQLAGNVKTKITPHFDCDAVVTEKMSNFYVQKIEHLRTNIKNTNGQTNHTLLQSINKKCNTEQFSFEVVNADQLIKIIKSVKKKSCVLDPAPAYFVTDNLDLLIPFLLHLINKIILTNSFPDILKYASKKEI